MTQQELGIVEKTIARILKTDSPALAGIPHDAIINTIMLRLRHEFDLPARRMDDSI
jgi:hypothetical protein